MTDPTLGEVLVLLHSAGDRWQTFRGTVRTTEDHEIRTAAFRRWADAQRGARTTTISFAGSGPPPDAEREVRAWLARPDRRRLEYVRDPWRAGHIAVVDGDRWWMHDPAKGTLSNDGDPNAGLGTDDIESYLEPAVLLPTNTIAVLGTGTVDGRSVVEILVTPRPRGERHIGHDFLSPGADDHVVAVDVERGAVLRVESRFSGAVMSVTELVDVAFDEPLADALFDGSNLPGARVSTAERQHPPCTIDEAAARVPFTVLAPDPAPADTHVMAMVHEPDGWAIELASVTLVYRNDRRATHVSLQENAAGDEPSDALSWSSTTVEGRIIEHTSAGHVHLARTTLLGTSVRLQGNVPVDELVAIAARLAPVRRPPAPS